MRRHIEKLRAQHPHVRTRVSLFAAAGITGVIALVWVTTLPMRFGSQQVSTESNQNNAASVIAGAKDVVNNALMPDDTDTKTESLEPQVDEQSGLQVVPNPTGTKPAATSDTKTSSGGVGY